MRYYKCISIFDAVDLLEQVGFPLIEILQVYHYLIFHVLGATSNCPPPFLDRVVAFGILRRLYKVPFVRRSQIQGLKDHEDKTLMTKMAASAGLRWYQNTLASKWGEIFLSK